MSEYVQKLYEVEEECRADELVAGVLTLADIGRVKIAGPVCLKRGTLLMSSGEVFVPASACVASADEVSILAEDVDLLEGEEFKFAGYFGGVFKGSAVILPYETEDDDHEALLGELEVKLRQQKIRIV